MGKIRVSAVKYANTYPFIYGLRESGFYRTILLETDHPSACAMKLIEGKADIGLIPVAAIADLNEYNIVSKYCIGADGEVRTVMMLSNSPFNDIQKVYLDYRSLSSVALTKVLAKFFWKRSFSWIDTSEGFRFEDAGPNEAIVLIGDQCFELENSFRYRTDLAGEWKKHTGLPFVFACWVSNRQIDPAFIESFNMALESGVRNIDAVVAKYGKTGAIRGEVLKDYLTKNIDYILDDRKKEAMDLFVSLVRNL